MQTEQRNFSLRFITHKKDINPLVVKMTFISLLLGLSSSLDSIAQFNLLPHPHQTNLTTGDHSKRAKEDRAMRLPFWDDFSFSGKKGDTLWAQKNDVIITNGFAIKAPTLGAAVMDGLRADGTPYETNVTTNGITDVLLSRMLALAEIDPSKRSSVYLSFQYQWKANGEAPDPNDYLQVDFLNDQKQWITMAFLRVSPNPNPTIFLDYIQQINSASFFHNEFQFRISRFGRSSGPFDTWAIDYVYLNQNRFATDFSFPDRAIGSNHSALFDKYYAVPQQHFYGNEIVKPPTFLLTTQQNEETPLDQFTYLRTRNYFDGSYTEHEEILDMASPLFISPFGKIEYPLVKLPDVSNTTLFNRTADSTVVTLKTIITSSDNISIYDIPRDNNADYDDVIYAPIDFRMNDTTQTNYFLSDFYAYDDGEAEYSIGLAQTGDEAAFRFSMLGPEPDTLTGVYVYFPLLSGNLSNIVDLLVFEDNNGKPGSLIGEEVIAARRPGPNVFHKIKLRNAVLVPQHFYIGWRQPANGTIAIGLDRSTNNNDKLFGKSNGTWSNPSNLTGTPMIRPIFGQGEITTSLPSHESTLLIYPNPTTDSFIINQTAEVISIHFTNGIPVTFNVSQQDNQTIVSLKDVSPGLVVVKLKIDNSILVRKIVIR